MQDDIVFYFDFASPYAYLAATRIDALAAAHGRRVRWKPVLITALCQATGAPLAPLVPLKWRYVQRDLERTAQAEGITLRLPPGFPRLLISPGRAMLWIERIHGQQRAAAFAASCLRAYFVDGFDIADARVLADIAAAQDVERVPLLAGMEEGVIKEAFKQANAQALQEGVFGVPFVIADGEPFWGFDHLGQLDAWLARAV
ncbi:MAG: 2-hydroxychromene-2-carboxylate isomerase [Pseudomonadota bacterium]